MSLSLLLASLLTVSSSTGNICSASVTEIGPIRPTTDDFIRIRVQGGCSDSCVPRDPRVEITAGEVKVSLRNPSGGCLTTPTAFGERVEIGRLPAGTRDLVITFEERELARKSITVTSPPIRVLPRFGREGAQVLLTIPARFGSGSIPVMLGGVSVPGTMVDASTVMITVPRLTAGLHDVAITSSETTFTAPQAFEYTDTPDPSYFLKVLFPVTFAGPGAFGSVWLSENSILNRNTIAVTTDVALEPIAPRATRILPTHNTNRGLVAGVPRDLAGQLWFSSHVRDLSRNAEDAGTELRVVPEHETRSTLVIAHLKVDPKDRYQLRAYDIDGVERLVVINIQSAGGGTSETLFLNLRTQIRCVTTPCITNEPAFGAIDLGAALAKLGATEVDIEIFAGINDARLWAFVSATNNETQHVTTYTPQR